MSINVQPTPEHQALAAAVNARMAADGRIVNAKAFLLRLAGVGALIALTGLGIAVALFGYSFVKDERSSADKIADSLVRALDRTTLKTAGEVKVVEGGTVKLDSATVTLDPQATVRMAEPLKLDPATTVKLDPNARVRVSNAPADQTRPTPAQLNPQPPSAQPDAAATKPVATNYTIFKNVEFGQGAVVTGWSFSSSEQPSPNYQYCYYVQGAGGDDPNAQVKVDIARNGAMVPNLRPQRFDIKSAAASCVWFDGGATRML